MIRKGETRYMSGSSQNNDKKQSQGINIGVRSFIIAIGIIFLLMVATYVLTLFVPGGEYARTVDAAGHTVIDPAGGFRYVDGGIPFWKWLLSPFLVLGAEGSGTIIAVLIFLLVIGGVFNSLTAGGLMNYMLGKIVDRYGHVKYRLMSILILFFMGMGSLVGSFEEVIPMAPIVVALAIALGWDAVTGVAISLLATGCGFAAGIANPFTIGVAQGLAGLPMFSGMWLRIVSFILIYAVLLWFIRRHARKVERPADETGIAVEYVQDERMDRGLKLFAVILTAGIVIVLSSSFIRVLQDYTMIIVALMFLVAGISSVLVSGMSVKELGRTFIGGIIAISPSVLMILMASSIKFTMVESKILDTLLHTAELMAGNMPKAGVILFIYLICLVMNFFISSGSAKAFLLIPIIAPLAQLFGISTQLAIIAFAFGDGFSNVIYPTNAGLLITLGLSDVSYGDWFRYSWRFQLINLVLTSAILLLGLAVGYA
ncbi:MAG: YfcC family protein [Mogibacterium sp.]|nr:YfcC family protein [Mogibacterium sp.]